MPSPISGTLHCASFIKCTSTKRWLILKTPILCPFKIRRCNSVQKVTIIIGILLADQDPMLFFVATTARFLSALNKELAFSKDSCLSEKQSDMII